MKLKMYTATGSVIIDTSEVSQFYPDHESGGELTTIEMINPAGEHAKVQVKHGFCQVTSALATAWDIDKKKAEAVKGNAGEGING
ncbi:hypothetical protein [Dickeya dianthicola]|uniref:hypothetical protein n=1 Tax=Dickeya dianthicola TaxID=204039 RepID=UPI000CD412F1|nr:hypothetical protein [Dickeya dianthicola]MBI0437132.1 hypothetical protein [Dickeya dianthicola]MBI0448666.1 hypothetical protein [Dickeya dianthicola]MBI0452093.1 hypothetical protein [Dickeya dianthicola]MBI0456329.1 hypothetical protein [Dickeya dianthicola]MBI0460487.1 hypothetical protein [Dickeya dianthicola]